MAKFDSELSEEVCLDCVFQQQAVHVESLGEGSELLSGPFVMAQVDAGYLLDWHICYAMSHGPCSPSDSGSEVVVGLP